MAELPHKIYHEARQKATALRRERNGPSKKSRVERNQGLPIVNGTVIATADEGVVGREPGGVTGVGNRVDGHSGVCNGTTMTNEKPLLCPSPPPPIND